MTPAGSESEPVLLPEASRRRLEVPDGEPDARLYAATGDTIWRFDAPPRYTAPLDMPGEGGSSGWVIVSIGVILAASLIVTLRLAARRR